MLRHRDYITVDYDNYLLVAKHRDGRYLVVDYNGDPAIDDRERDVEQIVRDWYQRSN